MTSGLESAGREQSLHSSLNHSWPVTYLCDLLSFYILIVHGTYASSTALPLEKGTHISWRDVHSSIADLLSTSDLAKEAQKHPSDSASAMIPLKPQGNQRSWVYHFYILYCGKRPLNNINILVIELAEGAPKGSMNCAHCQKERIGICGIKEDILVKTRIVLNILAFQ